MFYKTISLNNIDYFFCFGAELSLESNSRAIAGYSVVFIDLNSRINLHIRDLKVFASTCNFQIHIRCHVFNKTNSLNNIDYFFLTVFAVLVQN